jgi:hypothetical protein
LNDNLVCSRKNRKNTCSSKEFELIATGSFESVYYWADSVRKGLDNPLKGLT